MESTSKTSEIANTSVNGSEIFTLPLEKSSPTRVDLIKYSFRLKPADVIAFSCTGQTLKKQNKIAPSTFSKNYLAKRKKNREDQAYKMLSNPKGQESCGNTSALSPDLI